MKEIKKIKGYGVVGTWVSPHKLGGSLPTYLLNTQEEALSEAATNRRLMEFVNNTEQYLCEITIKPISKLKIVSKPEFKLEKL